LVTRKRVPCSHSAVGVAVPLVPPVSGNPERAPIHALRWTNGTSQRLAVIVPTTNMFVVTCRAWEVQLAVHAWIPDNSAFQTRLSPRSCRAREVQLAAHAWIPGNSFHTGTWQSIVLTLVENSLGHQIRTGGCSIVLHKVSLSLDISLPC
jgi:hypothetical protein